VVTLTFNEAILVPANYTAFNDSIIMLKMLPGSDSDITELGFDWKIDSFSSGQIEF